jgi:hypothetical protein
MTLWRLRIAWWITKVTHTHTHTHTLRICNTYCFSAATVVVRTRLPVTFYVQCSASLSCVIFRLMPSSPKQLLPHIHANWNLLCICYVCCMLDPSHRTRGLSAHFHCVKCTDSKAWHYSLASCEFLTLVYKSSVPRLILSYFLIFNTFVNCNWVDARWH